MKNIFFLIISLNIILLAASQVPSPEPAVSPPTYVQGFTDISNGAIVGSDS